MYPIQHHANQDEMQVSYDVVNLFPSVPIDKIINALMDTLNNNIEDIKVHTKLTLINTVKLTGLY